MKTTKRKRRVESYPFFASKQVGRQAARPGQDNYCIRISGGIDDEFGAHILT